MEDALVSLAVIALLASITPLLARAIPNRLVPETVFLLFAGAICGPHLLNLIHVSEPISLLSDLGLAFLFLLAGYEINPKNLTNYQGKRGFGTWIVTFAIAVAAVWLWPAFSLDGIDGIAVVIALTTTALGTLLPILRERNLLDTPIGNAILSYGTWGELCPVVAMALLLSTRTTVESIIILAIFAVIAVAMALLSSRLKNWSKIEAALHEGADTTQQTVVRAVVLLMVGLTALSAVFNLDIVLGSFAAGFILRYIIPQGSKGLEKKLDGLAFGFFIPLFFIVSGANIDLTAVGQSPDLLIFFIVLLLLIRALPIFIALSTGKHKDELGRTSRITVALYCTTALPIIVAVTTVAQQSGTMSSQVASVLVCAGAITVFVMPALASITTRLSDTRPVGLVKEISARRAAAKATVSAGNDQPATTTTASSSAAKPTPARVSDIVKTRADLVRALAKARALINKDDPDLAARIAPIVERLSRETTSEEELHYFIDELRKRYRESGGQREMTAEEQQEANALCAACSANEDAANPAGLTGQDQEEPRKPYDEEGYLEVIAKGEDASTHES